MDVLDNLINFIYPQATLIATLCAMAVGIIIAALASEFYIRKANMPQASNSGSDGNVFMKLKQIQLFTQDKAQDLQITTYVNGMEFHYPSSDRKKWLPATQKMGDITIELPNAELYRIHLAVHFRAGETLEGGPTTVSRARLQTPLPSPTEQNPLPANQEKVLLAEDYKLYFLEDGLRNIKVKAIIPYEIYLQ